MNTRKNNHRKIHQQIFVLIAVVLVSILGPTRGRAEQALMVDGHSFGSFESYLKSDYFRDAGKRCGTRFPDNLLAFMPAIATQNDCSLSTTVIKPDYDPGSLLKINVVFHVISHSDGRGNILDARIHEQIEILNQDFMAQAGSNGGAGINASIAFELATQDPLGNLTTGITRTVNDAWFEDQDEEGYKTALGWDQSRYLNIYVNSAGGYLGYAYLPQGIAGTWVDGVTLHYNVVGLGGNSTYGLGRTATHEVGHYLGLLHPFEGGNCPSASKPACYSNQDFICDTNPDNSPHFSCSLNMGDCLGFIAPIENYMEYTPDACMERFTSEQINRMRCSLLNYRSDLVETCPDNISLQNAEFTGTQTYTASQSVTLGPNYSVATGASLTIVAGQSIRIVPPFQAQVGSELYLHTDTAACISGVGATDTQVFPSFSWEPPLASSIPVMMESAVRARILIWSEFPAGLRGRLVAANARVSDAQADVNGKLIIFSTEAALVVEDDNNVSDVYLYTMANDDLQLISIGWNGNVLNGPSDEARLDAFGEHVLFCSSATNLVPGAQNTFTQLYLRDIGSGSSTRLTNNLSGEPASGDSGQAILAGDWIIFHTEAPDLDIDGPGIYRQNRYNGIRQLVGIDQWGSADPMATRPAADALGQHIAYQRPDIGGKVQIYLTDALRAELISLPSDPDLGQIENCCVTISGDGKYIAYREQPEQGPALLHICNRNLCNYERLSWPEEQELQQQAPNFSADGRKIYWISPHQGPDLLEIFYQLDNPIYEPLPHDEP